MMTTEQAKERLKVLDSRMLAAFEALGCREKETLTDAAARLYAQRDAAIKIIEGITAR